MDCTVNRSELVAFHFGQVEPAVAAQVERHLASCGDCLAAYFALKRSFEASDHKPSAAAKLRLRAAVVQEFGGTRAPAGSSWWQAPLAVVLAAFALVLAVAMVDAVAMSPYAGASPQKSSPARD
jgi:anti-sigma factor RsiW